MFKQPLDQFSCPRFNWGCRYVRVDHRTLIGKVWDNKAIIELGAGNPMTKESRSSLEGVFLRNRSLVSANLSESRLYVADMIRCDLRNATLQRTSLVGANLTEAKLAGAILYRANLSDAHLVPRYSPHSEPDGGKFEARRT